MGQHDVIQCTVLKEMSHVEYIPPSMPTHLLGRPVASCLCLRHAMSPHALTTCCSSPPLHGTKPAPRWTSDVRMASKTRYILQVALQQAPRSLHHLLNLLQHTPSAKLVRAS